MARLTEQEAPANAASAEAIELKRRFARQNRDLTRTNATQAAKIRSLEIQISNLLAENLSCRDTIIHLEVELDESRRRAVSENVYEIQRQLQAKLAECAGIVAQIGVTEQRSGNIAKGQTALEGREWTTRAKLSEILESQPGHLPTIIEDKHYPRKTLDASEIQSIVETSSASPEAGPPPMIHFEHEATSSAEAPPSPPAEPEQPHFDPERAGLLSANFETRKRRRETYVRPDESAEPAAIPVATVEPSFFRSPERLQGKPIRASRKRRLSAHLALLEEDKKTQPQEFEFTRKDGQGAVISNEEFEIQAPQQQHISLEPRQDLAPPVEVSRATSPRRPALGSRDINKSPQKLVAQEGQKEKKDKATEKPQNARKMSKLQEVEIKPEPSPYQEPDVAVIDHSNLGLEPKTPAVADILSPTSTQPSELKESRDTPPMSQSYNTTDGGAAGRGSRRARSQVNYAEPNLISKMRRPGKELVPAVKKDESRSTSAEPTKEGQQPLRVVTIKKEHDGASDWKPVTSGSRKELSRPEPQSPTQPRQDSEGLKARQEGMSKMASQSRSAIPSAASTVDEQPDDLVRRVKQLEIFDLKTSSPVLESDADLPEATQLANKAGSRMTTSRRQSAISSSDTKSTTATALGTSTRPSMSATAKTTSTIPQQRAGNVTSTDQAGKLASVDRGLAARGRRRSMIL